MLTFRVPNESASAGTVKVEASLPTETPFLSVSTRPVPGWSATTTHQKLAKPVDVEGTTITEAITTVTWTAAKGTQIGPAQFQDFAISVGPLPDPTTILLPTSQTYSDGTVVRWDQETPPSGEEPEHPAPEFTIAAATGEGHDAGGSEPSAVSREPAAQETAETTATASTDTTARVLAGIALMLGAAALVVALVGRRRGAA